MSWPLVFLLSLLGLAMGIATVFFVPSNIEPLLWLAIFLFSAYVVARNTSRLRFLHGLAIGIANSVWITAAHVILAESYLSRHAPEAAMLRSMPFADSPRVMMAVTGPVIGVISGIVIGILCAIAGRLIRPREPVETAR